MPESQDPKNDRKVWYLASPFYQYAEDIKKLARDRGLRIIDANVTTDRSNAAADDELPEVTIKPEYQSEKDRAASAKAAKEKAAADEAARLKAEKEAEEASKKAKGSK